MKTRISLILPPAWGNAQPFVPCGKQHFGTSHQLFCQPDTASAIRRLPRVVHGKVQLSSFSATCNSAGFIFSARGWTTREVVGGVLLDFEFGQRALDLQGEQDSGASVARAWRGRGAGYGPFLAWGCAGVARAWRVRGAGISCSP
eukprot:gene19813-biopygen10063